jgi:hypothetical protein
MADNIDAAKLAALEALLLKERERRASEEPITCIVTGVPDPDDDGEVPIANEDKAPRDFHARRRVSEALSAVSRPPPSTPAPRSVESSPDEGPYRVHAQTRGADPERGDPGEIAEGSYTISGGMVRVRDDQDRDLGSEVLRPGDDPKAIARSILRTKKAPNDFWGRTLH